MVVAPFFVAGGGRPGGVERGDLEHWHRIVAEVKRDPWGPIARQLEEVLSHSRPYGIADAMDLVLARAQQHAGDGEREQVAAEVQDAIARSGLSRSQLASHIGTSPSPLSTYAAGRVTPPAALMIRMRRVAVRGERHASFPLVGRASQRRVHERWFASAVARLRVGLPGTVTAR